MRIKENDAWQEYVVAHQGYPHRVGGNTLLLRRDVAGRRTIASTMQNEYDGSMADSWLSGAFLPTVDSVVSAKIPTCQIPYTGGGEHAPGYPGAEGFPALCHRDRGWGRGHGQGRHPCGSVPDR